MFSRKMFSNQIVAQWSCSLVVLCSCLVCLPAARAQTFGVYREMWTNLNASAGNNLAALTNTTWNPNWPNNPASAQIYTIFEGPTNTANYYGQRFRAFVVPPVSGAYTFWIASDDSSELLFSQDENPANVTAIARVNV